MKPELNEGLYVFCTVPPHRLPDIPIEDIFMHFREKEGITIVISEALAVQHLLNLNKGSPGLPRQYIPLFLQ
jgi:hypothetical protein